MSNRKILEAVTDRGKRLYIEEDKRDGELTLYCLDCDFDTFGKVFDELPRFYRTVRGAKTAAAHLVTDKLKWATP